MELLKFESRLFSDSVMKTFLEENLNCATNFIICIVKMILFSMSVSYNTPVCLLIVLLMLILFPS